MPWAAIVSLVHPHLVPYPPQGRPLEARRFELPPLFIFHHANAFEAEGGSKIVVDSIHYESLPAVGREALAEQQAGAGVQAGGAGASQAGAATGWMLQPPCRAHLALLAATNACPQSFWRQEPCCPPIPPPALRRLTRMQPSAAVCAG